MPAETQQLIVISDSLSVLQSISINDKNSKNTNSTLTTHVLITKHSPRHSKIRENEQTDHIAKNALTQSHPKVQYHIPITSREVQSLVKSKIDDRFYQLWKNNGKGLWYKSVIYFDKNNTNNQDDMTSPEMFYKNYSKQGH